MPVTNTTQNVLQSSNATNRQDFRLGVFGNDASGLRRALKEVFDKVVSHQIGVPTTASNVRPIQPNFAQYKLVLKQAKCTVAFKNVTAGIVIADVYECVNANDIDSSDYATAYQCWNTLPGDDGYVTSDIMNAGAGAINFTRTSLSNAGATPYHCPSFRKYWNIIKKTRINVPAGQIVNYEYFTPKKGTFSVGTHLTATTGNILNKGHVKDIIICVQPTYNDNTTASSAALAVQWTKEYYLRLPFYQGQKNLMMRYVYT